jgi:hypothetical protein
MNELPPLSPHPAPARAYSLSLPGRGMLANLSKTAPFEPLVLKTF